MAQKKDINSAELVVNLTEAVYGFLGVTAKVTKATRVDVIDFDVPEDKIGQFYGTKGRNWNPFRSVVIRIYQGTGRRVDLTTPEGSKEESGSEAEK